MVNIFLKITIIEKGFKVSASKKINNTFKKKFSVSDLLVLEHYVVLINFNFFEN